MSTKGIIARAIAGGVAGYAETMANTKGMEMDLAADSIKGNAALARQANFARFTADIESKEWDRRFEKETTAATAAKTAEREAEIIGYNKFGESYFPVTRKMYDTEPGKYTSLVKDLPSAEKDEFAHIDLGEMGYVIYNKKNGVPLTDTTGGATGLTSKDWKEVEDLAKEQFNRAKDSLVEQAGGPLSSNQTEFIMNNYRRKAAEMILSRKQRGRMGAVGAEPGAAPASAPAPAGLMENKMPRTSKDIGPLENIVAPENMAPKTGPKPEDFFTTGKPGPEKVVDRITTAAGNAKKNLTNPEATEIGQGNILDDIGIIGRAAKDPTVQKQVTTDLANIRDFLIGGPLSALQAVNAEMAGDIKQSTEVAAETVAKAVEAIRNNPQVQQSMKNLQKNLGKSEKDIVRLAIKAGLMEKRSGI